ncbi:MAG: AIR synthase-related protein, partial [Nitrospirota bacterium]
AGWRILRRASSRRSRQFQYNEAMRTLLRHQCYPAPRLAAGRALADYRLATAMMDLSDGLMIDLDRLCLASGVGATLTAGQLPISPALAAYARTVRQDPLNFALAGGEDYELLFTVRPAAAARCARLLKRLRVACRVIGRIDRPRSGDPVHILHSGRTRSLRAFAADRRIGGFEHFAKGRSPR